jgi:proline racemase
MADTSVAAGERTVIATLDVHTAGEPLRIITAGLPIIPGATMLERRHWFSTHLDHIRRALIWEPRGHYDMYGAVITPPVSPGADLGVLFMHNAGYSTMCGHGIIALVTALFETGALAPSADPRAIVIDTPAGIVRATAQFGTAWRVEHVTFQNVPAFLAHADLRVPVPGYGELTLDLAFGGAFYAILPAAAVGLRVTAANRVALVAAAAAIKTAVDAQITLVHPADPELGFLYGIILTDTPADPAHHSRNICVFAAGEVDRSPTGTGVSARLAVHHARGELGIGEPIVVESILGARSVFRGQIIAETVVGPYAAIVPEIGGSAWVTGRSEFVIDPRDELGQGFLL